MTGIGASIKISNSQKITPKSQMHPTCMVVCTNWCNKCLGNANASIFVVVFTRFFFVLPTVLRSLSIFGEANEMVAKSHTFQVNQENRLIRHVWQNGNKNSARLIIKCLKPLSIRSGPSIVEFVILYGRTMWNIFYIGSLQQSTFQS